MTTIPELPSRDSINLHTGPNHRIPGGFFVTPLEIALAVLAGCLLSIVLFLATRRTTGHGDVGAQVVAALQPWLQTLQPLKENADQRLPVIQKTGADLQRFLQEADLKRQAEEKLVREALARLQEATKTTPEVHKQVAILQEKLEKLKVVERGVKELQELFLSTQGRGKMGEEAIRAQFEPLPNDLWDEQFELNGRKVDFIVRMPNGRVLPIDSKTSGMMQIREYAELSQKIQDAADDATRHQLGQELRKLASKVRHAVLTKSTEVALYIQPDQGTLPIAIQAVPDSLYAFLDAKARREASELHVQFVPYGLLLVVINVLRSQNQYDRIDLDAVVNAMHGIRLQTKAIEDTLENKLTKAAKFVSSGVDDIRGALTAIERNAARVERQDGQDGPAEGAVVRVPVKRSERASKGKP